VVSGINLVTAIEPLLLISAFCAFLRSKSYKSFPAFGFYLAFRLVVDLALILILQSARSGLLEKHFAYHLYYYGYWISYLVGAVVVFLVIQEVFAHLIKLLPGFDRVGLVAFRWVTLTSVLVAVALSIRPGELTRTVLVSATSDIMRCMSILELCLLAFVVIAMQTFKLSVRSRDFGVALGLALLATAELLGSVFAFGHSTMATVANYGGEVTSLIVASIWAVYFLFADEPVVQPSAASPRSPLKRWSEVADALGHPPPQIALGAPTHFFLQDVERAVDRVLENNSGKSAS
jgi:hypothetical protein